MAGFAYWLAIMGFNAAGWTFWRSLWWPYYLARRAAQDREG